MTSDHSLVEAQVQAGLIDREQSLKSEHQNILLRALGRDPDVEVELDEVPMQPAIAAAVQRRVDAHGDRRGDRRGARRGRGDPQGVCDQLVATANANGGPDNVTVVVVEFAGSRLGRVFEALTAEL